MKEPYEAKVFPFTRTYYETRRKTTPLVAVPRPSPPLPCTGTTY